MATQAEIVQIIKDIFQEEMMLPVSTGDVRFQQLMDEENGVFELKMIGWDGTHRIYGTLFHFEIINDKIIIHHDSSEEGIATIFERRGIPKTRIILGWIPPSQRKHTDYATT